MIKTDNNLNCDSCGFITFTLEASDLHGYGIRCSGCNKFIRWTGRGKEKKNNPQHRKKHRADGEMVCDWCGMSESEARELGVHFAIDHREAEQFGGSDDFENTRPLCSVCHYGKTAAEHKTKAIRKIISKMEEYIKGREEVDNFDF